MAVVRTRGAAFRTVRAIQRIVNQLVGQGNAAADGVDYMLTPDGVMAGSYAFAAAAQVTIAVTGWVKYRIAGIEYTREMPATITLTDNGDIAQNAFGAWRIEIDRLGACTATNSTILTDATEQIALLRIASIAPTASACTIGYMTIVKTGSAFNIGTDNLTVATATATFYYERSPRKRITGLNAARGSVSILNPGAVTVNSGTVDHNVNGLKKAQIAAAATQAITDADTVTTLKFGAILLMTNLAATGVVSLNAAGTPGVTAMAYNSAALALAALNDVVDRLPGMFCPISYITINNQIAGTFTVKTTFWDAAGATCAILDATAAGWVRATPTGFNSHQVIRSITMATTLADSMADPIGTPA